MPGIKRGFMIYRTLLQHSNTQLEYSLMIVSSPTSQGNLHSGIMTDYMRHYLALNQVGLGRLVALASDNDTPSRYYCNVSDVNRDDETKSSKRKWENNDVTLNTSSSTTLRVAITKAGIFLFSKERKSQSKLRFDEGYTYELLNFYDRFDNLLEDTDKGLPGLRKY
jgi:hypothetical protein